MTRAADAPLAATDASDALPSERALAPRRRARRWLASIVATLVVLAAVHALAHRVRAIGAASRTASRTRAATTARVGKLLYRVESVRRATELDDEGIARARSGLVFVVLTVTRSNATQTYAPVTDGGLRLLARDGERYAPYAVRALRCERESCEVLDPGDARTDELVYLVPDQSASNAQGLEVLAATDEPGPRAAVLPLP